MVINNKELSARLRLGFMMFVLLYLIIVVLSVVLGWTENHRFALYWSVFFVLAVAFFFIKGYNYIYFNTDGSRIILRYMGAQPLLYSNNAMEIPKNQFVKYKIKKSHFGLRTSIILYQRTEKGLSKYPPVGIDTLTKSERRDMLDVLDKLSD
ncbi:MAG: hypothetical protein ACQES0_01855 [Bacteroidota bacterium]